jgi:ParB family chromosome partitioning protein
MTTTLPLNTLKIDPMNVRRNGGEPTPEFIASIAAHGIIEPLQVRPNGKGHTVFAGGNRLRSLEALAKAGKIAADYAVKVDIHEGLSDADARERSLAENFVREDMHPVDEYRAFLDVHADKSQPLDAEQIATRFGLDVLHVRQRLALGALDDAILDAWLEGQINEDAAEAFTLCPSKKAQVAILKKLGKGGQRVQAREVKRELKGEGESVGKYLAFVGKEAYEARGGKVTEDLFGTDHTLSDQKLMMAMVAEKTEEVCKALTDAGWSWAIQQPNDSYSYGTMEGKAKPPKELADKLAAAEKALDTLQRQDDYDSDDEDKLQDAVFALEQAIAPLVFTDEQKKKAGCFVRLNSDGELEIHYGRVRPAEKRAAAAAERKSGGGAGTADAPKPSEAKVVSNALRDRLSEQLIAATKKALKADKAADGLPTILKDLVAGMIGSYGQGHVADTLPAIRDAITPKVMNEAIRKEFKRDDYFGNAPIPVLLAAITEAVGAEQAKALKGKKKADLAKFAMANVAKTDWLPKELRTANYDGPGGKAKTAARKSK